MQNIHLASIKMVQLAGNLTEVRVALKNMKDRRVHWANEHADKKRAGLASGSSW